MAGLVLAIHALYYFIAIKTWMPGTRPGMTAVRDVRYLNCPASSQNTSPVLSSVSSQRNRMRG